RKIVVHAHHVPLAGPDVTADRDNERTAVLPSGDPSVECSDPRVPRLALPLDRERDRTGTLDRGAAEWHDRYVSQGKSRADPDRAAGDLHGELRRADDRRADAIRDDLEWRLELPASRFDRIGELAPEVAVVGALAAREVFGHA